MTITAIDPRREQRDRRHLEDRARVLARADSWPIAIGRNPATVTSVPVSIGKAVLVYAKLAARKRSKPCSSLIAIISTAMIASSTRSPSDRISAPSEILCRPMSKSHMNRNVTASTSGIDTATTSPVRRPRLTSDTASTMSTASVERADELVDRALHGARHARDLRKLDAHRQLACSMRATLRVEVVAELDHVAALDHRDAQPERLAALPAHLLLRRIDVAAGDLRDVAQAEHAVVGADGDVADRIDERRTRPWAARRCGRSQCRTRRTPRPRSAPPASG